MKNFLKHPLAKNLDLDSPDAPLVHGQVIRSKPFLQKLYHEWYQSIVLHLPDYSEGKILELGSGGGSLNTFIPNIIASDIQLNKDVDIILDAKELPFSTCSLNAIVMIDVFHHINDVDKFLQESIRCLTEKGKIIMIEPWITFSSVLIYKYIHNEPCLPESKQWSFSDSGPLSGANLALPWIVFKRDKKFFFEKYNKLKINDPAPRGGVLIDKECFAVTPQAAGYKSQGFAINAIDLDWPFIYLLSGGVSMKTFVPERSYPFFRKIERLLAPAIEHLAMFAVIVLEKRKSRKIEESDSSCV